MSPSLSILIKALVIEFGSYLNSKWLHLNLVTSAKTQLTHKVVQVFHIFDGLCRCSTHYWKKATGMSSYYYLVPLSEFASCIFWGGLLFGAWIIMSSWCTGNFIIRKCPSLCLVLLLVYLPNRVAFDILLGRGSLDAFSLSSRALWHSPFLLLL